MLEYLVVLYILDSAGTSASAWDCVTDSWPWWWCLFNEWRPGLAQLVDYDIIYFDYKNLMEEGSTNGGV